MSRGIRWRRSWFGTCWWGFCPDEDVWNRERVRVLRKCSVDIGEYAVLGGLVTCYRTPDKRFLVTLADEMDGDPVRLVATIAHESVHVARRVLESMAEDEPGEETFAYMVGDVAEKLFRDYISTRGKRMRSLCE